MDNSKKNGCKLKTDEDIIEFIKKSIKDTAMYLDNWKTKTRKNYDFYSGEQWEKTDIDLMQQTERQAIVFNRVARTINAITGLEQDNRQQIRFLPRNLEDAKVIEVLNSACDWVRDLTDAEDEESEAFQDTLISGYGWCETHVEYDEDPDGRIVQTRVDPLEMGWDKNAKQRNLGDSRFIFHIKRMTWQDVQETWPNIDLDPAYIYNQGPGTPVDQIKSWYYASDDIEIDLDDEKKYEVARFQWWEKIYIYRVEGPKGIETLSETSFKSLKKGFLDSGSSMEQMGIRFVKQHKKVYREVFYSSGKILNKEDKDQDVPYAAPINDFSFRAVTGLRDRNRNLWFGVMDLMRDPQMWYNKWLSQTLRIMNTNAKGGLIAEQGAFVDPRAVENDYAKPNNITYVNQGYLDKVRDKTVPQFPNTLSDLISVAKDSITDTPGLSLETLGVANRNQPASLEMQRRESSVTILSTFFTSLRRYRKEQGRVLCEFITKYISDGRMIRIVGNDGASYIPLYIQGKDDLLPYDIIVDEAPSAPNMKARTMDAIMGLLPLALQANIPIPPDILDYTTLPENLIAKWKEAIAAPSQVDPAQQQMQQQMQQLELMMKQLQVQGQQIQNTEHSSKAELNKAQAYNQFATADNEEALAKEKTGANLSQQTQEEFRKNQAFVAEQQRQNIKLASDLVRDSIKNRSK